MAPITGCGMGCMLYDLFVFTGTESPLNWRLPNKKELKTFLRSKGRNVHGYIWD